MLGGYHYAYQQQQPDSHKYGNEPEIDEASESYIGDINRFEAMLTPDGDNTQERRVEDEANASYMHELNSRMDKALGEHTVAQVVQEDARQQQFFNAIATTSQPRLQQP